ncbi:MAG: hypothetical protein RSA29_04360 [Clostridium sp.]|uniref:hypothetical protein n=1 Tax=Clostridium sp. TaxID=1506 RepID=UPI00302A636D
MDRIYLGATIDINKEQYLPIMEPVFKSNVVTNLAYSNLKKFDDTKIISTSYENEIIIRDIRTFEVYKSITTPRKIVFRENTVVQGCIAVNNEKNKIYVVTTDSINYYISCYDMVNNTWTNTLIDSITMPNGYMQYINDIFIDNQYLYIHCSVYSKLYKISLLNCTLVADASIASSSTSIDFDGNYFYGTIQSEKNLECIKFDKITMKQVAKSLVYTHSSNIGIYSICTDDSFIYISASANILKVDKNTLLLVAKNTPVYTNCNICIDKNNLYSICKVGSGFDCNFIEYDKNTLSKVGTQITFVLSNAGSLCAFDNVGKIFAGSTIKSISSVNITSIEKSYTIESYKKIKELI